MATASKRDSASGCPTCGKPMSPRVAGEARPSPDPFPFCSARCQLVDLGRWLGDEYRVPDRDTVVWPPDADGGTGGSED